jgi:hypothetical protein
LRLNKLAIALPIVLLAACGEDAAVAPDGDAREASGEILPGSIGDAMIETDNLQSQPPLLREVPQVVEDDEDAEDETEAAEPQTLEEAFSGDLTPAEAPQE